jgi:hypothetical protein
VRIEGESVGSRVYDVPREALVGKVLASGKRKAVRIAEPD